MHQCLCTWWFLGCHVDLVVNDYIYAVLQIVELQPTGLGWQKISLLLRLIMHLIMMLRMADACMMFKRMQLDMLCLGSARDVQRMFASAAAVSLGAVTHTVLSEDISVTSIEGNHSSCS